jgi:hypothetical protein
VSERGFSHPVLRYAGRPAAASPATGFAEHHERGQRALLDEALTVGLSPIGRIGSRKAMLRKSRKPS